MNSHTFCLPLLAMGALAACQVTGTAHDPERHDADEPENSSRYAAPAESASYGASAPVARSAGAASGPVYAEPAESSRLYQEPRTTSTGDSWGPGTMHISLAGNFVNDETKDEPSDPGDDIETMELSAAVGRLLTDRVEVNVQGSYYEADVGVDDVNRTGVFGGLRYHVLVPDADQHVGIYAEGIAGILTVDSANNEDTAFAYGASVGGLWFPWGVVNGMAVDISVDWLQSSEVDRIGASAGLAYYW